MTNAPELSRGSASLFGSWDVRQPPMASSGEAVATPFGILQSWRTNCHPPLTGLREASGRHRVTQREGLASGLGPDFKASIRFQNVASFTRKCEIGVPAGAALGATMTEC